MLAMLAALAGLGFVLPGNASATPRPATPEEAEAIGVVYGALPFCSDASISTIDGSYATWSLKEGGGCGFRVIPDTGPEYPIVLAHFSDGAWGDYYQASTDAYACEAARIPPDVGAELGVCMPASKHLYVSDLGTLKYRPRLLTFGAHAALVRLDWRDWDTPRPTAWGTLSYSDAYDRFRVPIRVELSYQAFCGIRRIYYYMRVTARRAADRKRIRFASGRREMTCETE